MNKMFALPITAMLLLGSSLSWSAGYDLQITNNSLEQKPFVLSSPKPYATSLIINAGQTKNFVSALNPAKLPIAAGTRIGTTTWPSGSKTLTCVYTAPAGGAGAQLSVSQLVRSCSTSF